jgi:hypothetical protein
MKFTKLSAGHYQAEGTAHRYNADQMESEAGKFWRLTRTPLDAPEGDSDDLHGYPTLGAAKDAAERAEQEHAAPEQVQEPAENDAQETNGSEGDVGDAPARKGKGSGKGAGKRSGPPKRSRKPQPAGGKLAPSKTAPKPPKEDTAPGTWWRLATITNEKSGRELTLELKKDGSLVPSDVKRTGIQQVGEWTEIKAVSRVEALKAIDAGDGKRLRRKGGKIVEA